jgi:oligosaccharide repeat unit polymerase
MVILFSILGIIIGIIAIRFRLTPIAIGVICWTPAILLSTIPRTFISPLYGHLNHQIGTEVALALAIGFLGFFLGTVLATKSLLPAGRQFFFDPKGSIFRVNINQRRLTVIYIVGLITYLFSIINSGLVNIFELNAVEISESRDKLHLGSLSFLVFFLDIAGLLFFVTGLQQRKSRFFIPLLFGLLLHVITLQKSSVIFLLIGALYVTLLESKNAKYLFFNGIVKKIMVVIIFASLLLILFAMNALRGIGVVPMTEFDWTWFEQIYIYSGATAILNLSASILNLIPTGDQTYGLMITRPIMWYLVDRSIFDVGINFEGVNNGTYLYYFWKDFRWVGFFIGPFLMGAISVSFMAVAVRGTVFSILLGVLGFKAIIFSPFTDVIFDPTTWIFVVAACIVAFVLNAKKCRN